MSLSRSSSAIDAVILNYRAPFETLLAVKSLLASRGPLRTLYVVDNDPSEECSAALAGVRHDGRHDVRYLKSPSNLGFSGGMNLGIRAALASGADGVLLVNSDVIVPPDCVGRLARALDDHTQAGIAGPLVLARAAPDRVASRGMTYHRLTGRMRHRGFGTLARLAPVAVETVDAVSGCLMLIQRRVFDRIGLLDDEYFFSFEDLEFCLRAKRDGFATIVDTGTRVYHEGSQSLDAASPLRLYFAARNHLRLGAQRGPSTAAARFASATSIVALNVAHALRPARGSAMVRLRAVARGVRDHYRGKYGQGD